MQLPLSSWLAGVCALLLLEGAFGCSGRGMINEHERGRHVQLLGAQSYCVAFGTNNVAVVDWALTLQGQNAISTSIHSLFGFYANNFRKLLQSE